MTALFESNQYVIRRKVLKIFGASFHVRDMHGGLLGFCSQKAFKLREDIRIFADEAQTDPLITVKARSVIDFAAAYDIHDANTGESVGTVRRRGMRSLLRDSWEILNTQGQAIGKIQEDSMLKATLRRFATDIIPQTFTLEDDGHKVTFRQHFNPFVYRLEVTIPPTCAIDRRLIFGIATLLAAVEGRQ